MFRQSAEGEREPLGDPTGMLAGAVERDAGRDARGLDPSRGAVAAGKM